MKFFILSLAVLLILGLGFVGGIHYILNIQYQRPLNQGGLTDSTPVTSEPVSLSLNLDSPSDNNLTFSADMLVSGKTSPGATLIINLNDNYRELDAKTNGDFSATLKLQEGVNNLSVNSFDNLGNSKNETRIIYYSEEKI